MAQMVITAVGPDRPGLVGEFSGHLYNAQLNVADSRMVNLRGQFALIMLVEAQTDALAKVRKELPAAADRMGLAVSFADHHAPVAGTPGLPFRLKTYSLDQPGIVHRVSALLQKNGVNIEDLQTRQESAAFMGGTVFTLEARISVPARVLVRELRSELDELCAQLNCDLDLEPA